MGKIEYNIRDLYTAAFGYVGAPFPFLGVTGESINLVEKVRNLGGSFKNKKSSLGQDLYMPIKLDGYQLPNEPLISVRGSKNLVRTTIAGSDGEQLGVITELTGIDPYRVRIRGVIVGADGEYPEDVIRKIADLCQKRGSLEVENAITTMLGITRLVVEDFGFPGIEGVADAEAYEISAYSEESLEAELNNQ